MKGATLVVARLESCTAFENGTGQARPLQRPPRTVHELAALAQDSLGGSRVHLEVVKKLVELHAVREPVEQLLDGHARAAETGCSAHPPGIDPNGFFQRHRLVRVAC